MSGFLEATTLFFLISSSSSVIDVSALPCRCGCRRGKWGFFKGKAPVSSENTDGSSVRNASRDIALVLEKKATCRERLSIERRAMPSSIAAGLYVQLRFPMMLLIIQEEVNRSESNNFSAFGTRSTSRL
jgi:hypothetical protein